MDKGMVLKFRLSDALQISTESWSSPPSKGREEKILK